jgi:hypothetical protein
MWSAQIIRAHAGGQAKKKFSNQRSETTEVSHLSLRSKEWPPGGTFFERRAFNPNDSSSPSVSRSLNEAQMNVGPGGRFSNFSGSEISSA